MMIGLLLHLMRPAAFSFTFISSYICFPGTPVLGFSAFIWKVGKCCAKRWTVEFSPLPGGKLQAKRKDTKEKTSVSFGAEGETRQGAALSVRCANDPILCPFLLRKKMDGSVLVSPGWEVANKKKRYQGKSLIPFGAEGETRTLAPVARPTPLAGAPRHQLEYFCILCCNLC